MLVEQLIVMIDRTSLLLSAQKALLGVIRPNVRGISVARSEQSFAWRVYFDKEPSSEEKEEQSIACTEIIADFEEALFSQEEMLVVPWPEPIECIGDWVYLRWEKR